MAIKLYLTIIIISIVSIPIESTYFRAYSYPGHSHGYGNYYPGMISNYRDPFSPYNYAGMKSSASYQQPSYWTYQPTTGLIPRQPSFGSPPSSYGQSNYGYPGYSSTSSHRSGSSSPSSYYYPPSYTSTSMMSYPNSYGSNYGTSGYGSPSTSHGSPSYGSSSTGYGNGYSYGSPTSFDQAWYGHHHYGSSPSYGSSSYGSPNYRDYRGYYYPYYPSSSSWSYDRQPRWPSSSYHPYSPPYQNTYQNPNQNPYGPPSPWMMDPRMAPPGIYPFPFGRGMSYQKEARAVMKGNPGSAIDGSIDFIQMGYEGIRVKGRLYGVPGGQFTAKGLHILNSKSCPEILPATQTIDHFNPHRSPTHGPRDGVFKHAGDLGNIFVQFDGVSIFEFTSNQLSLDEPNSIVNRSIIITERADDLGANLNPESRRTGNAGKAIACGIIALRRSDYAGAGKAR